MLHIKQVESSKNMTCVDNEINHCYSKSSNMSVKPVLMVLYTNDAVEVRNSDQSRLHILPCGTSFTFHTQTDSHPVHGMSTIQQRSSFVTSQYRNQLISALDFRNRFAERPFLCLDLIAKEEIINLYAKIEQIAWPKTASKQHCEILDDGSVRILSVDEFASVILSPHRKDFTVCYLSLLSQERQRDKVKVKKNRQTSNTQSTSSDKCVEKKRGDSPGFKRQKELQFSEEILSNRVAGTQTPLRNVPKGNYRPNEDLNISPITQASCGNSPSGVSHASGSPVTPQDTVKDGAAKFRPFSTPTEEIENIDFECKVFHVKHGKNKHLPVNREGSFLGEDYNHPNMDITKSHSLTANRIKDHSDDDRTLSDSNNVVYNQKNKDFEFSGYSTVQYTSTDDSSGVSDSKSRETRHSYCWVTRHISRDECPRMWSYAVKMAEQIADKTDEFRNTGKVSEKTKENKTMSSEKLSNLRRINKDNCVLSEVPCPLPLTCKGQYLHKGHSRKKVFDDGKDPLEDWTSLNQGCLRVILVDGVVYRIVRLQTINSVEVYPGDGSVLVSQGMSAHFFLHIIPGNDKVEERTYSVKSPPQSVAGNHSVKTLMNRAHRLLAHVRQEVNMPSLNTGLCCWKHEDIQLEEPLSTVLLEECSIPGYGRFTAMSNGQIRILFKDRTALDMTCDFSKRLKNCLDHSSIETSVMLSNKKVGTCRLLLPNGHYQLVDVQHPGQYKKYIQMAKEWSDWVNSSPGERETFYKERFDKNMNVCVDRELQKIKCFNYVVDNTVLNRKDGDSTNTSAFRSYGDTGVKPRPGILRNVEQNTVTMDTCHIQSKSNSAARSVQIHSPPHKHDSHRSTSSSVHLESVSGSYLSSSNTFAPPMLKRLNPIGQSQPINFHEHKSHVLTSSIGQNRQVSGATVQTHSHISNLEGFNAVRQALLKTSNVIKDLDALLDKR